MALVAQHLVAESGGGWALTQEGRTRALKKFKSRQAAIQYINGHNSGAIKVYIHDSSGRVESVSVGPVVVAEK
ncbi:MAG: DUF2188 domain-containing protein [Gammaproteobacteria bacterium]|nr:DUF2188 domain-containing protein [Gammaproteobacteria bacterium]MBU2058722.1 DUF2188 domain-containing protein [Gammaproteobacteria bacterium]MBU2176979.1 DUF2188 domain-containing protein [Gammaproteobacteria bacterium]MBU2246426.1 DUF2188 domain-containing protein [Gammaproteobacteria bacterium]MBU2345419.1 DUF2188 domain-containing protein [Gammaproteobacteria bacterium]